MSSGRVGVARLRDPEYTGENRCVPCTGVNIVVAVGLALAVGVGTVVAGVPGFAGVVSTGVFAIALAAIYFRGYLIPGTPWLTKRYFPAWLLGAFGKDRSTAGPSAVRPEPTVDEGARELDVESVLREAGVLTERTDVPDLTMTEGFRRSFRDEIDVVRDDATSRKRVLRILTLDDGDVEFEAFGSAFRVRRDGTLVGTWESRPAFLADVAAGHLLGECVDDWHEFGPQQRGQLLAGLRLFLTTCPGCDGDITFGRETVESCCSARDVSALTCEQCGARLFEASIDE